MVGSISSKNRGKTHPHIREIKGSEYRRWRIDGNCFGSKSRAGGDHLTARFRAWLGGSADAADRVLVARHWGQPAWRTSRSRYAGLGPYGHLPRFDGTYWFLCPFSRNLIRVDPLDYSGLLGEGSTPVRLPPPPSPSPCVVGRRTGRKSPSKVSHFDGSGCTGDSQVAACGLGDRIFLQSFVLRHFGIVRKSEGAQR